jgi:hypothetical protein
MRARPAASSTFLLLRLDDAIADAPHHHAWKDTSAWFPTAIDPSAPHLANGSVDKTAKL